MPKHTCTTPTCIPTLIVCHNNRVAVVMVLSRFLFPCVHGSALVAGLCAFRRQYCPIKVAFSTPIYSRHENRCQCLTRKPLSKLLFWFPRGGPRTPRKRGQSGTPMGHDVSPSFVKKGQLPPPITPHPTKVREHPPFLAHLQVALAFC